MSHLDFEIVSDFEFMLYALYICRESSTNQPFLCNSNPIVERPKMNANVYYTKEYEKSPRWPGEKNKPKQSQFRKFYDGLDNNVNSC